MGLISWNKYINLNSALINGVFVNFLANFGHYGGNQIRQRLH